jgi:hypothetical protein
LESAVVYILTDVCERTAERFKKYAAVPELWGVPELRTFTGTYGNPADYYFFHFTQANNEQFVNKIPVTCCHKI